MEAESSPPEAAIFREENLYSWRGERWGNEVGLGCLQQDNSPTDSQAPCSSGFHMIDVGPQ